MSPRPGRPTRPYPCPQPGTHGSAVLREGASSCRPESTRSPYPSPATPGPGHGGWPRSRGVGISGPPSGRSERALHGVGESERLRPNPLSRFLKYPRSNWVSFASSDGVSFDAFNPLQPQLGTLYCVFHIGVWGPWGHRMEPFQVLFPTTFAQSSYFI